MQKEDKRKIKEKYMWKVTIFIFISIFTLGAKCETPLEKTTKELYANQVRALKCLEDIGNFYWKKENSCPVPICGNLTIKGEELFRSWNEEFRKMGYELRLVKLKKPSDEMLIKINEAYKCIKDDLEKNNPNARVLLDK